jgi:transposase-like protein
MNPLHMAIVSAVIGRKRRCPACGKEQVLGHPAKSGRFRCKKCGHHFTKKDLESQSRPRG